MMIYIHIPYCKQICFYCDFYKVKTLTIRSSFVEALCEEIRLKSLDQKEDSLVQSIYWGGGTPSLLDKVSFAKVMNVLRDSFDLSKVQEQTLEADPETFSEEKVLCWKENGINRISLGAQSFVDEELKTMGRSHSARSIVNSYVLLKKNCFHNISIDLLVCTPKQTLKSLNYSLQCLVDLNPTHLSVYSLNIEKKSIWGKLSKEKLDLLFDHVHEDESLKLLNHVATFLKKSGYERYEISNYAKKECFESKHNWGYWNKKSYLGFGPSAHSYDGKNYRTKNKNSIIEYCAALNRKKLPPLEYCESLSEEQKKIENFFLTIRTKKGIPVKCISPEKLNFLQKKRLVILKKNAILTLKGQNLYNEILKFLLS